MDKLNGMDVDQVFKLMTILFDEASHRHTFKLMREQNRIEELKNVEKHGYEYLANRAWQAGKHIYCQFRNEMDTYYESIKPQLTVQANTTMHNFENARYEISKEMEEELENQLLDPDPK